MVAYWRLPWISELNFTPSGKLYLVYHYDSSWINGKGTPRSTTVRRLKIF
jgi:hypothetical protein